MSWPRLSGGPFSRGQGWSGWLLLLSTPTSLLRKRSEPRSAGFWLAGCEHALSWPQSLARPAGEHARNALQPSPQHGNCEFPPVIHRGEQSFSVILVLPKPGKPIRRQRRISSCALQVSVSQVVCKRSSIVPVIGDGTNRPRYATANCLLSLRT